MGAQGSALFRREVFQHRADRLHGAVSLATPLAWQMIGFLLLAALIASVALLSTASYARIETVSGTVALDTGVASVVPSRAGVVEAMSVREGSRVRAGQPLVRIRSEESLIGGATAPERIRAALGEQDRRLAVQGDMLMEASAAERGKLQEQIAGLGTEMASLDGQIADERRLVDASAREYADVQKVAANGFISRRDLETREATLLGRRQQLAQLQELKSSKRAEVAQAQRAMTQSLAQAQAQVAGSQSSRAALAQQSAQADLASGYALVSPVDGVVTAVTARIGQPAAVEQPLMMIVPSHSRSRAELYVPTAAAGFLAPGQEVRVAIDAFPYERFGTLPARVVEISSAAVPRQGPSGPVPVYLVTAGLADPAVRAFGRRQPLLPGMTLTARIVTEKRSLLEWLFEPIFAVRNR